MRIRTHAMRAAWFAVGFLSTLGCTARDLVLGEDEDDDSGEPADGGGRTRSARPGPALSTVCMRSAPSLAAPSDRAGLLRV